MNFSEDENKVISSEITVLQVVIQHAVIAKWVHTSDAPILGQAGVRQTCWN